MAEVEQPDILSILSSVFLRQDGNPLPCMEPAAHTMHPFHPSTPFLSLSTSLKQLQSRLPSFEHSDALITANR
jgi:hypothetical protein